MRMRLTWRQYRSWHYPDDRNMCACQSHLREEGATDLLGTPFRSHCLETNHHRRRKKSDFQLTHLTAPPTLAPEAVHLTQICTTPFIEPSCNLSRAQLLSLATSSSGRAVGPQWMEKKVESRPSMRLVLTPVTSPVFSGPSNMSGQLINLTKLSTRQGCISKERFTFDCKRLHKPFRSSLSGVQNKT